MVSIFLGVQCGYPAEIPNGDYRLINGTVNFLSQVVYTCNKGFHLQGRAELTCDLDERWDGPPPNCVREYSDEYYSFVTRRCGKTDENTSLFLRLCLTKYTRIFTAAKCPEPQAIENGELFNLSNSTEIGATIEYGCTSRKYKLFGSKQLKCLPSGVYDNPPPSCKGSPRNLYRVTKIRPL